MKIVINSSPLIFLARLDFLECAVHSLPSLVLPKWVEDEIAAKRDDVHSEVQSYIKSGDLNVQQSALKTLAAKFTIAWEKVNLKRLRWRLRFGPIVFSSMTPPPEKKLCA